jgi:hypothetical protein
LDLHEPEVILSLPAYSHRLRLATALGSRAAARNNER